MPMYMYQAAYSKDAIANLVQNPQNRTDAIRAVCESMGGIMVGCWMAFGEDDIIVIVDMPNDEGMAAVAMAVAASGAAVRGRSTKLLTMEQAVSAMNKANKTVHYQPLLSNSKLASDIIIRASGYRTKITGV